MDARKRSKTFVAGAAGVTNLLLAVACSTGSTGTAPATAAGELPCDVAAVLENNCRTCHASPPRFGAPMPLLTLADLRADAKLTKGKKVYEQVGVRIHDDAAPMPQAPNPRLGASDMATLDAWIAAGAPAGTATSCADNHDAGQVGPPPLACEPDQKIRPTSKYAIPTTSDIYVCYGFDTEASAKRHVIAGAPRIDNTKIVHHILLYQADAPVGPTPQPCGAGGGKGWRLVTGWAPGGKNFELPPEAGFAEEAGQTHWAVQIHYNNTQGLVGEVDATGYDLCTTDSLRPNDADILATGTFDITIPPRSVHETTCEMKVPQAFGKINVISSWAHMHRLGRAESAKRVRGGEETTLLDAPAYDFSTGAAATAIQVEIAAGDMVRTMCRWQNTTDATVTYGEKTSDEMCFAFLTYYPKITVPSFTWQAPSAPVLSKCTATTTK